jgi:hypothetical protein
VIEEKDLNSKVSELMTTLDEVKKYKETARSIANLALILLVAIVAVLFEYIGFNLYFAIGGEIPQNWILSGIESIISSIIIGAGFIFGVLWVNRRVRKTKVGEWRKELQDNSNLGAMKILSGLDWPSVFQDIRYSKIGFIFYGILKIVGYWILVIISLSFVLSFGLSLLHFTPNFYYVVTLSLIVAVIISRKDLQRRYTQSWALDSLLWELRWFESEFRRKAGEIGTTPEA